jgi:dTDP-4-amino-4,6-dideoxygalactose transaminase
MTIVLNKPVTPNIKTLTKYLEQVHESGWYTNFGPLHQQLTQRLEEYLGVENLLLVSNGTLAIQVACKALNVKSAITTPFSFVATTSALLWQGIGVAFCDIDRNSYNISPKNIENALAQNNDFDAIVATHVYGNSCDVDAIQAVANKYDKKVIYDAAHAFGVNLDSESILNFGDASTLSFHATKVFHTIEGGAIIFKNKADYQKAKQFINFGIQQDGSLGEPGINAKLNEYQCAVGLTLLDEVDAILDNRSALFQAYRAGLKDVVEIPVWHEKASFNGAYMPIYIPNGQQQQSVISALLANNIQCRRYFTPSLDLAYIEQKSFGCEESNRISKGVICLPLHNYLSIDDVNNITQIVSEVLN